MYPLLLSFGMTLDLADRHPCESIEKCRRQTTMQEYLLGFTYIAKGEE